MFAVLLFAMLLGSINYNNNLGYILTFLLGSIAVVAIFFTYRNLLNLSIGPAIVPPVFVGRLTAIPVQVDNQRYAARFAIEYHLPKNKGEVADIAAKNYSTILLPVIYARRGRQALPRFVLSTTFPLGLFRAWAHIELQQTVLVFPRPGSDKNLPQTSVSNMLGDDQHGTGDEDFDGLRNYQVGDSFYRIHWKSVARHQVLQTKQYSGSASSELWIDWEDSHYADVEKRISQLTRWVMLAGKMGIPYGFRIPGVEYGLSSGLAHRNKCLEALALYEEGRV